MNYNYNNLTPKTRKAVEMAVDMRINGKRNNMSLYDSKTLARCTLLLAIIESDSELQKFLNELKSRSIYEFNADLNENDKILTLSSCYNNELRVVLHAKLIKREQR